MLWRRYFIAPIRNAFRRLNEMYKRVFIASVRHLQHSVLKAKQNAQSARPNQSPLAIFNHYTLRLLNRFYYMYINPIVLLLQIVDWIFKGNYCIMCHIVRACTFQLLALLFILFCIRIQFPRYNGHLFNNSNFRCLMKIRKIYSPFNASRPVMIT